MVVMIMDNLRLNVEIPVLLDNGIAVRLILMDDSTAIGIPIPAAVIAVLAVNCREELSNTVSIFDGNVVIADLMVIIFDDADWGWIGHGLSCE
jgi:hypothetical protein